MRELQCRLVWTKDREGERERERERGGRVGGGGGGGERQILCIILYIKRERGHAVAEQQENVLSMLSGQPVWFLLSKLRDPTGSLCV